MKRFHYGGYCATSGCAWAHPREPLLGSRDLRSQVVMVLVLLYYYYSKKKARKTEKKIQEKSTGKMYEKIVRGKKGRKPQLPNIWSLPIRAASGDVTSGSTTSHHLRKCDLKTSYILLTYILTCFLLYYIMKKITNI